MTAAPWRPGVVLGLALALAFLGGVTGSAWQAAPGAAVVDSVDDGSAAPPPATVQLRTRRVAGWLALMQAVVLAGLYRRWRAGYVKAWIAMWLSLAAILFLASIGPGVIALDQAPGRDWRLRVAQVVLAAGTVVFVGGVGLLGLSATWYRREPSWPGWMPPVGVAFAAWTMGAAVFAGPGATFVPAVLLGLALFTMAAIEFFRLARRTRAPGAAAIAVALAIVPVQGLGRALLAMPDAERPDGLAFWTLVYGVLALGQYLLLFEDVTGALREKRQALVEATADLKARAITDPLTGCRNRRFFDEVANHELAGHRRRGRPLALLFVDCDRFKLVNDTLGHETGDRLLEAIGGLLRDAVGGTDIVFRWGGDEFLVLLSGDEHDASRAAAAIREGFHRLPIAARLPAGCGISVGHVSVPPDATDLGRFVKLADERMYGQKRTG
ncbi:MAG: GGDEF domain-containing protein [Vicinamibacterales bacterium]